MRFRIYPLVLLLLCGCSQIDLQPSDNKHNATIAVRFSAPEISKATGEYSEVGSNIEELYLYVFDAKSGGLELLHQATSSEIDIGEIIVSLKGGYKHLHIIANPKVEELKEVTTHSELEDIGADLRELTDLSLTMIGSKSNVELLSSLENKHTISLKRMAARVWVKDIEVCYSDYFVLDSIYFLGAVSCANHLDSSPAPSATTYDRMLSDFNFKNYDTFTDGICLYSVFKFSTYNTAGTHYYLFENTSTTNPTTLVITGTMDNKRVYYPISLSGTHTLNHNHQYSISLKINGPGAPTPNQGLFGAEAVFVVEPWSIIKNDVEF